MALEAVVYSNDIFNYGCKELYSLSGSGGTDHHNHHHHHQWMSYDNFEVKKEQEKGASSTALDLGARSSSSSSSSRGVNLVKEQKQQYQQYCQHHLITNTSISNINSNCLYSSSPNSSPVSGLQNHLKELIVNTTNSSPEEARWNVTSSSPITESTATTATNNASSSRRKRRRTKSSKNIEEVENQRMTHIFVERNRRKQMNEYLSVLRSLMPPSYVQKSDQASIVGGAINFLKELEQLLQSLEAQNRLKQLQQGQANFSISSPFGNLFSFPDYTCSGVMNESVTENRSLAANIEVTKVESHANLKILSRRRPKQLLKMVVEFQKLRLTILHLSVTTVDQMVLYSFSIKVEEECQLTSVDEISMAVSQVLDRINEEASG